MIIGNKSGQLTPHPMCVHPGKGNVSLCAEFNFAMDPEAAYVVLEEFLCPTYMVTWEYACRNALSWVRCEDAANQFPYLLTRKPPFMCRLG